MRNTGNSIIASEAELDAHLASDRLRGEAVFGPLVLSYDTPADGEGATDIMRLHLDRSLGKPNTPADLESLICQALSAVLEAVDADWTMLIHTRLRRSSR